MALSAKNKNMNTYRNSFTSLEFDFFRFQLKFAFRIQLLKAEILRTIVVKIHKI